MRRIALAASLVLIAAFVAAQPEDSPLVKAAKASGGPKKKSTKKVITNKDVKKSGGKLIVLPAKAPAQEPAAAQPQRKGPLAIQDDQRRVRLENEARVSAAEKKVADLEKELRRLEEAYYAENDPNYRDATIGERFNQTKRQLETARKQLADARDGKPSS